MSVWTISFDNDEFRADCQFRPECDFCGIPLIVHKTMPKCMKLNKEDETHFGHALDVIFSCPECGGAEIFGVALSEEEYGRFL